MSTIGAIDFDKFYALLASTIATFTPVIVLLFFQRAIIEGALTIFLPKIFEKQVVKLSLRTIKDNERLLSRIFEVLADVDISFDIVYWKLSDALNIIG